MRLSTHCVLALLLLLSVLPFRRLEAQDSLDDSLISDAAYRYAILQYHQAVSPEVGLYRGPQYIDYTHTIQKGQPFFGPDSLRRGTVWYGGIGYDGVSMEYDLVKDQLAIADFRSSFRIALLMEFVDSFRLDDQQFIKIRDSVAPDFIRGGYCDRLYGGTRFALLKRDRKFIHENLMVTPDNVRLFIDESSAYYWFENGKYHPESTKAELLAVLKDRQQGARRVIRKSKSGWRRDKEPLLLAVAQWYNGV